MKKISRNDHFPFPIIMPIINWPSIPHVHPLVSRSKIERTEEGVGRMWNRQKRTKIKLCRDEWNWSRSMNRCWNEWMIILSLLLPFLRLRLYLRFCCSVACASILVCFLCIFNSPVHTLDQVWGLHWKIILQFEKIYSAHTLPAHVSTSGLRIGESSRIKSKQGERQSRPNAFIIL